MPMKSHYYTSKTRRASFITLFALLLLIISCRGYSQAKDVILTIHLRGVFESKISVLAMSGTRIYKPILEVSGIKNGETAKLTVPKDQLPGECVIRFDYKENESSTPYPSEKNVFIYEQDLELWVRPQYCNNGDSTWFQKGERENAAFAQFSKENAKKKEKLGLLQNFLMNYDDTESAFYKQGIAEYKQRRNDYNDWLQARRKTDKSLFVSNMYAFQYVPETVFKGSETERLQSMIAHYFDGMDFQDPLLITTSYINKWMDNSRYCKGQCGKSERPPEK